MVIKLVLDGNIKSNLFLRALWSNFREVCGNCSWIYMPYKENDNNRIFLGLMNANLEETMSVYVWYKVKGVIDKLEFLTSSGDELKEKTQKIIENVVNRTKEIYLTPFEKKLRCCIKSKTAISLYKADLYEIYPMVNNISSIVLDIKCFGEKDEQYIFQIKLKRFLDVLSALTNLPFYTCELYEHNIMKLNEEYYGDDDYIEGYPVENGMIKLPSYGKKILNEIMIYDKDIENENVFKLLNTARLFHAGRKFEEQLSCDVMTIEEERDDELYISLQKNEFVNAFKVCDNLFEMAIISYISALEVLSTIVYSEEAQRCSQCGQLIYSISHKVKDLLIKYLGELGKEVHKFYTRRSKFLHEGRLLSHTYIGTSIPQLDVNSKCGAEAVYEVPLLNLRECVGYCIRCVIKEYFVD